MVKYPEDWKVVRLSDVGEVCMCKRVLKSETSQTGEIPFYKIGTFGKTPDAYIRRDLYEAFRRAYSYPKAGEVLISAAGTIGRTVVFNGADSYFQDSNIVWLANDEKIVSNDYLYWCYQVVNWQTEDGGIVARLYNGNFRATKILAPPLPEQRRIAAILGNVDKLIDNLAKRIEKKRLVKQGVMQDLLSGKKRLPGFSGEWEEIAFGDCFELLRNNTCARSMMTHAGGKIHNIHYGDILVQYGDVVNCKNTTIPCLTEEGETFACKEYLQDGDIVIADTAEDETAGKVIEVRRVGNLKIVSGLHTVFCRPKSAFAEGWLGHWMNSPLYHRQLVSLMTGIKVLSLSRASFMKTKLAVPTFVEQQAIAKVLGGMDAEIAKLEAKRDKYLKIKQGLMNDLLTGKVRVGAGETAETAATLGPVSEGLGVSAVLGDAVVSETVEVAHG